eukprot:11313270-Ditylum_brightwellii.AAC.1
MALLDMELVNSDVHFHLCYPTKKQWKHYRYNYYKALENDLITTYQTKYMQMEQSKLHKFANNHENSVSRDVTVLHDLVIDTNDDNSISSDISALSSFPSDSCIPSCVGVAHETVAV